MSEIVFCLSGSVRILVHYDDSLSFIMYYPLFFFVVFCISSFPTISHASDACLLTSSEVCAIHSTVAHNSPIISIYSIGDYNIQTLVFLHHLSIYSISDIRDFLASECCNCV